MSDPTPWYRRMLVGIEVGPTGANDRDDIYMARANGREIVENLRRARVEYAVLFLKDHEFAYYNSRVFRKHPNLGARDLLRECLDEARPHGLPIIAYVGVQYDAASWRAHPDWRMRDSQGNEIPNRLCYNSGYLDLIQDVVGELMEYEIAGFHIDMLDFGFGPPYGCWCEHCRAAFREAYGMEMPPGVTWDETWEKMLEFRYNSNTRFCQHLQSFIRGRRPELSVDFNYHGQPPFSWWVGQRPVHHAMNGDFVTAEGLPWGFGHNNPSLLSLFMAGARLGGLSQGVGSRGVYDYHDYTVRPTAEMKWEVATYLAHGAMCTIVDKVNYDGTLDAVVYQRMGEVFSEALARREFFGHPPVPEVGLYYSCRSRDWFGREDCTRYMTGFYGAHKALVQAHIPLGIVMDENVSAARLAEFPLIYLANAAILTDKEVALLEQYVGGGGRLLVTGLTGCYDLYGRPQEHCALEGLLGARLVQVLSDQRGTYLRLPQTLAQGEGGFLLRDIPSNWNLLTYGPLAIFQPSGAQAYGDLLVDHRTADNSWTRHLSPARTVGPGVLVHSYGKGMVIGVACTPDAAFIERYRMPEHRHLIRNCVRFLNPEPPVVVEAPANVEIVVARDAQRNRLLIHLLCFSGPATATAAAHPHGYYVLPTLMEEPMHYQAQIKVNLPFDRARAASGQTRVERDGSQLRIKTKAIHEVVVIES